MGNTPAGDWKHPVGVPRVATDYWRNTWAKDYSGPDFEVSFVPQGLAASDISKEYEFRVMASNDQDLSRSLSGVYGTWSTVVSNTPTTSSVPGAPGAPPLYRGDKKLTVHVPYELDMRNGGSKVTEINFR